MAFDGNELLDLVVSDRLRKSSVHSETNELISSESDKGRVVNSAAFRRLQQKAQVFPLDENAAVRTRLTHSIEVSQVGRFLAQKVIEKLNLGGKSYENLAAFVNAVETSCLLHDIGNPPFGHLGEAAIRNWFRQHQENTNLRFFDGNPQGFRLACFLSGKDEYGLNLTATLLLSCIKYPWVQKSAKAAAPEKFGIFDYDYEKYKQACELVGWEEGKAFPLAKLMEAADDIAYCTSDLEDGLEKNVIQSYQLREELDWYEDDTNSPVDTFVKFKTDLIRVAVEEAAEEFVENIEKIGAGEEVKLIDDNKEAGGKIKSIKSFARKYIYSNEDVEKIELAGNSAIKGILGHFRHILEMDESRFECLLHGDYKKAKAHSLEFDMRVFNRLPKSYVKKYEFMKRSLKNSDGDERDARNHLVVDFISGMTDDFAIHTYQVLQGIRVR
ncbi:dGTP triphosphohydrolase [Billgrantia antri]|uniref:DNTP triphosphohydrolase n=1 Tax=Billgrantia antri TaxID=2846777 RepID=A0ABS6ZLQ2_9GAMM|nr:dNTP triphosphohydrolase [Halomonas antri]MBW6390999.1 dNTP triphosphohydrolase [Halomonas antri]